MMENNEDSQQEPREEVEEDEEEAQDEQEEQEEEEGEEEEEAEEEAEAEAEAEAEEEEEADADNNQDNVQQHDQPVATSAAASTTMANDGENKDDIKVDTLLDTNPDPVIVDLLKWLEANLPNAKPEDIFKQVRRLQKVFDTLISLPMEYFLARTGITPQSEDYIDSLINCKKEYISLSEEKLLKTKKLEASTAKLDLKRRQFDLVTSINLDDCMDRISRHNHLMSKK